MFAFDNRKRYNKPSCLYKSRLVFLVVCLFRHSYVHGVFTIKNAKGGLSFAF